MLSTFNYTCTGKYTAKVYLKSIHQKIIHCNEKKLGACST